MSDYQSAQSNITIKIDIVMPSERDKDLILRQLKDSVNPFVTDFVSKSIMLVNGQQLRPAAEFGSQIDTNTDGHNHRENNRGDMMLWSESSPFVTNLTFIGMDVSGFSGERNWGRYDTHTRVIWL